MAATKKKPRARRKGVAIVDPKTPGAARIDFTSTTGSSRVIEGTFADLIRDGHDHPAQWVCNLHADPEENKAAFLLGRGWSATPERRKLITRADIPAMAINDYPKDGPKPRYWCTGDPPHYFSERVWTDPDVMKFVGLHSRDGERPRDGAYAPKHLVRESPNTFFFHQATNETDAEHWLFHPYISWGSTIGCEGGPQQLYAKGAARSSMFIGMKLLFFLGYRRIYLCGCDCTPHHHAAPAYYETIIYLLNQIAQHFKRWGLQVYQTNRESFLRCFDFADFEEAVA